MYKYLKGNTMKMFRFFAALALVTVATVGGSFAGSPNTPTSAVGTVTIDVNQPIPSAVTLKIGERLRVTTDMLPGNAMIASVVCTTDAGQGASELRPLPSFFPISLLEAIQPGSCTLKINTYVPPAKVTQETTTIVTVTP
jgi:hypothetical protein